MMKIVHISTVHCSCDARIFHKEAKSLAAAGYDVILVAEHDKDETLDNVKIIGLSKPKNRLERFLKQNWRALRIAIIQRAEIYHFHDPEFVPAGVLLKLIINSKVVYDVHEDIPNQILNKTWLPIWARKPIALGYRLIEKMLIRFLDAIIIAEDSYRKYYFGMKDHVAIRNYPIIKYTNNIEQKPKINNDSRKEFKTIYVGGITEIRGAIEIVKAIKILKDKGYNKVTLHLVGSIYPVKFKEKLVNMIHEYDLEDVLILRGIMAHKEVFKLMSEANVGLAILRPVPNYIESIPTKLFEYMASRLPVVASNFPLWRKIVEDNHCGICVNPMSPEEIARSIEYLFVHQEEARILGENGRRAVEEKYNWEQEAEKLLRLYRNLIEQ